MSVSAAEREQAGNPDLRRRVSRMLGKLGQRIDDPTDTSHIPSLSHHPLAQAGSLHTKDVTFGITSLPLGNGIFVSGRQMSVVVENHPNGANKSEIAARIDLTGDSETGSHVTAVLPSPGGSRRRDVILRDAQALWVVEPVIEAVFGVNGTLQSSENHRGVVFDRSGKKGSNKPVAAPSKLTEEEAKLAHERAAVIRSESGDLVFMSSVQARRYAQLQKDATNGSPLASFRSRQSATEGLDKNGYDRALGYEDSPIQQGGAPADWIKTARKSRPDLQARYDEIEAEQREKERRSRLIRDSGLTKRDGSPVYWEEFLENEYRRQAAEQKTLEARWTNGSPQETSAPDQGSPVESHSYSNPGPETSGAISTDWIETARISRPDLEVRFQEVIAHREELMHRARLIRESGLKNRNGAPVTWEQYTENEYRGRASQAKRLFDRWINGPPRPE